MATPKPIPAPLSERAQTALHLSGLACILAGLLAGALWLSGPSQTSHAGFGSGSLTGPAGFGSGSLTGVLMQFMMAAGLFSMPSQIERVREARLKQHRATTDAPPVETPRQPDAVFLGIVFGFLSLVSLVVAFAPAAVISGIVALAQGHLKGLIGIALGVASLAVWAAIFVYFSPI